MESQLHTINSEHGYMVETPYGDLVDLVIAPNSLPAIQLNDAYRVVVVAGLNEAINDSLASLLTNFVEKGGTLIIAVDDALNAIESNAFSSEFLGFKLGDNKNMTTITVASVEDLQTGWQKTAPETQKPFCALQNANESGPFYIKTGGDPNVRNGWDGGIVDKCCSTSGTACIWCNNIDECAASLAAAGGGSLCRKCDSCRYSPSIYVHQDVGCPSWILGNASRKGIVTNVQIVEQLEAQIVLQFTLTSGVRIPAAVINYVPTKAKALSLNPHNLQTHGSVLTLLAPSSNLSHNTNGLEISAHLLERLRNDTMPIAVSYGNVKDCSISLQLARLPNCWQATLINSQGVTKQPNAAAVISGTNCTVLLAVNNKTASIRQVWQRDGARSLPQKLKPNNHPNCRNCSVNVEIEAGGVKIVQIYLTDD